MADLIAEDFELLYFNPMQFTRDIDVDLGYLVHRYVMQECLLSLPFKLLICFEVFLELEHARLGVMVPFFFVSR